jgi:hypothetical protein
MKVIQQMQQEIRDLAARLDRLATAVDQPGDVGGLYQEQIRYRAAAANEGRERGRCEAGDDVTKGTGADREDGR